MRLLTLCCSCLTFVLLLGCAPEPKKPIRIGINAWPGYGFLTVAEQLGYFKEAGVEVKLIPFQTLADGRRAFEKNQIDIMGGTLMELYAAREAQGVEPVAIMMADFSNGGDMLLAHKAFTSVAQLKGKKIGLEVGSIDVLTAANALASAQLSFADVALVSLPQPSNIQALLAGEIDAAQTYPPFATEALANPNIVRLFDTSQTPGVIVDVLLAHRAALHGHEAEYAKIVRAFARALQYHATHTEDANRRMAEREGITPAEFADALSGIQIIPTEQQAAYLSAGGKLVPLLAQTHAALTSINAITGKACGAECFSDAAIKPLAAGATE